jgi:hypothetical protein
MHLLKRDEGQRWRQVHTVPPHEEWSTDEQIGIGRGGFAVNLRQKLLERFECAVDVANRDGRHQVNLRGTTSLASRSEPTSIVFTYRR